MVAAKPLAGVAGEFDGAAQKPRRLVGADADGREALVARLVARRDRDARAGREIVVVQLLDGVGALAQHARGPERARDVAAARLELGREPAVQDHGAVCEERHRSIIPAFTMIAFLEARKAGLFRRGEIWRNVVAGVVVGIVALPLAMAFAIASGAKPEQGLYTAIVAGLAASVLGGTRVQVSGPTGAFIAVLAGITAQYGIAGLQAATLMAGVMLLAMGFLQLGSVIRFIPNPVIVGFTSGIAVIIFVGQWQYFFGLPAVAPADAHFHEKLWALAQALPGLHPATTGIALFGACDRRGRQAPARPHSGPRPHPGAACRDARGDCGPGGLAVPRRRDDRHGIRRHPALAAYAAVAGDRRCPMSCSWSGPRSRSRCSARSSRC